MEIYGEVLSGRLRICTSALITCTVEKKVGGADDRKIQARFQDMRVVTFEMSNVFVLSPSNSKAAVKERNRRLRKNRLLEFIARPYYSRTHPQVGGRMCTRTLPSG